MILALTRYDVAIPKFLASRKAALEWVRQEGERYGCSRIVRTTSKGRRTIWKPEEIAV